MSSDEPKTQEHLTPDARRRMLRAFADRMLIKLSNMDDPADLPGVERAIRTAAAIERIYSRCDRAERHTPDPRKLEAERAQHAEEAVKARVHLANTLKWGQERQKNLGKWWDAADTSVPGKTPTPAAKPAPVPTPVSTEVAPQLAPKTQPATTRRDFAVSMPTPTASVPQPKPAKASPKVDYIDYTDAIRKWRVELGLTALGPDDLDPDDDLDEDDFEATQPRTGGRGPPSG